MLLRAGSCRWRRSSGSRGPRDAPAPPAWRAGAGVRPASGSAFSSASFCLLASHPAVEQLLDGPDVGLRRQFDAVEARRVRLRGRRLDPVGTQVVVEGPGVMVGDGDVVPLARGAD